MTAPKKTPLKKKGRKPKLDAITVAA